MDQVLSSPTPPVTAPMRSLASQLERVERVFITYPRFEALRAEVAHCHQHARIAAEPPCLFISGPTGVGKTTLIKTHAQAYPRQVTETGTRVPVLMATIPAPATVKGLAASLLAGLGDPNATRGTTWSLTDRLKHYVEDCQVELIVLDELQHFVDRDQRQILQTVSDWLKVLIKDSGRPVVLLGLAGEAEKVLDANPQLARLFAARRAMAPFQWKPEAPKTITEFRCFLALLDQALPLAASTGLAESDLAYRIFYASRGVVGDLMALVRYAVYLALNRGQTVLDRAVLAEAYTARLAPTRPGQANPFASDRLEATQVAVSGPTAVPQAGRATNRRGQTRKPKPPRANDVLKT